MNLLPRFRELCDYEAALVSIPLDAMQVSLDTEHLRLSLTQPSLGRSFSAPIYCGSVQPWINGCVLAFLSNALGYPFEPFIAHKQLLRILGTLNGMILHPTRLRDGFNILVDTDDRMYGVFGPRFSRPRKDRVHEYVQGLLERNYGVALRVDEGVATYGRLRLTYSIAGKVLVSVVYGNDTGCSAYEIRWDYNGTSFQQHRQWRHNEVMPMLHGILDYACRPRVAATPVLRRSPVLNLL